MNTATQIEDGTTLTTMANIGADPGLYAAPARRFGLDDTRLAIRAPRPVH